MTTELPVDPGLVQEAAALDIGTATKRHGELVEQIDRANRLYHVEDAPEISDAEYDQLFRQLVALETALSASSNRDELEQIIARGAGVVPGAGIRPGSATGQRPTLGR